MYVYMLDIRTTCTLYWPWHIVANRPGFRLSREMTACPGVPEEAGDIPEIW